MVQSKIKEFKQYVKQYQSGNHGILDELIIADGQGNIKGLSDRILNTFYHKITKKYKSILEPEETQSIFWEWLYICFEKCNLIDDDGRERSNGAILTYFKDIITHRIQDRVQEENQYKRNRFPSHKVKVTPTDAAETDFDIDLLDKAVWQEFNEFVIEDDVKNFLELVDIKSLLRLEKDGNKLYSLYQILLEDVEKGNEPFQISQRKIAKKLGVTVGTISNWEKKLKKVLKEKYDSFIDYKEKRFTRITRDILDFLGKYDVLVNGLADLDGISQIQINRAKWKFVFGWLSDRYRPEDDYKDLGRNKLDTKETVFTALETVKNKTIRQAIFDYLNDRPVDLNVRRYLIVDAVVDTFRKYLKYSERNIAKFLMFEEKRCTKIS